MVHSDMTGLERQPKQRFGRLKRCYFIARNIRSFLNKERELSGVPATLSALRLLKAGFHSDKRYLYERGPDGLPQNIYVGDFERLMKRRINGEYGCFLDDKLLFNQAFSSFFRCPLNYGLIESGRFSPLSAAFGAVSSDKPLSDPNLPGRFVLKRASGGGGKNIYLVVKETSNTFLVNGIVKTVAQLSAAISESAYLATELLTQGEYTHKLYPHSINTVRVVTMRDEQGPFVAFAVQRIGRECSRPTDNLNRGGMAAAVDIDSGVLGDAKHYESFRKPESYSVHPETGAKIAGQCVPQWVAIKKQLLDAMRALPALHYVGWDVVVQDDGFLVLEGNSYPGVQVAQLHYPLKSNPRIKAFFERWV